MRSTIRKGFTLIELLIVVVIIGILAAIAIPKFSNTKEKAYTAAMKSDLKNMVSSQEAYFSENQTYAADTTALKFTPSGADKVTVTMDGTATGWSAKLVDSRVSGTGKTCMAFGGSGGANKGDATTEGVPLCQ